LYGEEPGLCGENSDKMLKQTTQLIIKALIIGLLVNAGLQLVPITSSLPDKNTVQIKNQQPLKKSSVEATPDFSDQTEK
jgi:hypothetical protein